MESFEDLKGSLKEKIEKATIENKECGKPVFLMVGDSGVGKSTIITQILKKISTENLEKMRINHTQEGTKGAVVMEEENLIIIDYKGKTKTESSKQYIESLESVLKDQSRIEFLIGVVESASARDDDIMSLSESIRLIADKYDLPFIIMMNKHDCVNSETKYSQYKHRKQMCKDSFYGIKSSKTTSFYSRIGGGKGLCIGIFKVSAQPDIPIEMKCPNDNSGNDFFSGHGLVRCCGTKGFYCKECRKFWVLSTVDWRSEEYLAIELKKFPIEKVEVSSIGFETDHKAMKALLKTCTDSKVFAQIVKSISSDYSSIFKSIPSMVEHKVFSIHWAQKDKQLAIDIAYLFDLKLTSLVQPNDEEKKWTKVSLHSTVIQIPLVLVTETLNRLIVDPSRETLGAWALFYGLKYKSVAEKFIDYISHHKLIEKTLSDKEESLALATIAQDTIKHFNEREETYVKCLLKRIENSSLEKVCSELSIDPKVDIEVTPNNNGFKSKVKKATREFLKPIQVKCKKNYYPTIKNDDQQLNELTTKETKTLNSNQPDVIEENSKSNKTETNETNSNKEKPNQYYEVNSDTTTTSVCEDSSFNQV
ncbi:hypothetical protein ACTFIV_004579 [Dictyostelium citrinum]